MLALLAAALIEFGVPAPVIIRGYTGHAMEPFLTRDGRYLLFNNSNSPPDETDLYWAERLDDVTFDYRGRIDAANSPALDGVPTADRDGNLYFVTLRGYSPQNLTTIYRTTFPATTPPAPVPGLSRGIFGQLNFDVEVSADGNTLYFVDGTFTGGPVPAAADFAVALRQPDGSFQRRETGEMAAINTAALEYAAGISDDGLSFYFTRIVDGTPTIFVSLRSRIGEAWGPPQHIDAIPGFAEAATVAPGGKAIYYHAQRNGRFVIERLERRITPKRRAVQP